MKYSILFLFLTNIALAAKPTKSFLPKTFSANLIQSHKSSLTGKIKSSKGKIFYKDPNKIRIKTTTPTETVFVSNRTKTWFYRAPYIKGESGELTIKNKGNAELTRFFGLLKQGLKSNKQYDVIEKGNSRTLVFKEEIARQVGFLQAELIFKDKNLNFENINKMNIKKLDKKNVEFKFTGLKKNVKLKEDLFHFVIPPKARVTREN